MDDENERSLWEQDNFLNAYRNWLLEKMDAWEYGVLFDILSETEFTWSVERDADRAANGRRLRVLFAESAGLDIPDGVLERPCSFLEMCIALAIDLAELEYEPDIGDESTQWFWVMLANVHLDICDDEWMFQMGDAALGYVLETVTTVMDRGYSSDGTGGLFPLGPATHADQRGISLWYQANAYSVEQHVEESLG